MQYLLQPSNFWENLLLLKPILPVWAARWRFVGGGDHRQTVWCAILCFGHPICCFVHSHDGFNRSFVLRVNELGTRRMRKVRMVINTKRTLKREEEMKDECCERCFEHFLYAVHPLSATLSRVPSFVGIGNRQPLWIELAAAQISPQFKKQLCAFLRAQ